MNTRKTRLFSGVVLVFFILTACNLLAPTPEANEPGALYTQAAQTVIAQLTQASTATPSETGVPATNTAEPTATATDQPTVTSVPPTNTPTPTDTATPTPSPTPIPCNWARFVEDVTITDGTVFVPNANFTKTWRIKNTGTCTWSTAYELLFVDGSRMDAPRAVDFPDRVRPGETVDLSVALTAPEDEGRYRGYWMLRDDTGEVFGVGEDADGAFWVEIKVIESDKYAFDFTSRMCLATWRSGAGRLDCPGDRNDGDGFVLVLDKPEVEIDRLENEAALWTRPEDEEDGWIRGEYPDFEVEDEQHFKAVVGCLNEADRCNVIFQLNYRLGDDDLKTLWEQREVYDGNFTRVDVDLSSLDGEEVSFVLSVLSNGSSRDDDAFWLAPRIVD
jgi:hypothetical protein